MPSRIDDTTKMSLSHELECQLVGRVCVLGVGNRCRRDDAVGSLLAERLAGRTGAFTIDAGAVPENYLEKVARTRPDTILIVDAVDFGGAPGDVRLIEPERVGSSGLSTHALSLRMATDFLRARTQARLVLLAIQPGDVRLGTGLSEALSEAACFLVQVLAGALRSHD